MADQDRTKSPPPLTDEQKKVCYAWALWVQDCIREDLLEHGIVSVEDEGFDDVMIATLNDIAQSNAIRGVSNAAE